MKNLKNFSMILAADDKNGIGKQGLLPWRLKKDMQYFQKTTVTTQNPNSINVVIMGRKTWESIPKKYRPLPGRINCILTRDLDYTADGASVFHDFETCLKDISDVESIESVFVIGGSYLYNAFLDHKNLNKIYLTHVEGDFGCDIKFDGIPRDFQLSTMSSKQKQDDITYYFATYIR